LDFGATARRAYRFDRCRAIQTVSAKRARFHRRLLLCLQRNLLITDPLQNGTHLDPLRRKITNVPWCDGSSFTYNDAVKKRVYTYSWHTRAIPLSGGFTLHTYYDIVFFELVPHVHKKYLQLHVHHASHSGSALERRSTILWIRVCVIICVGTYTRHLKSFRTECSRVGNTCRRYLALRDNDALKLDVYIILYYYVYR